MTDKMVNDNGNLLEEKKSDSAQIMTDFLNYASACTALVDFTSTSTYKGMSIMHLLHYLCLINIATFLFFIFYTDYNESHQHAIASILADCMCQ